MPTVRRTGPGTKCLHCDRQVSSRGYCQTHYERWRLGRDMDLPIVAWGVRQFRDAAGNKRCIRCSEWLAEQHFHVNKKTADGLAPWCKRCARWRHREMYWGLSQADFESLLLRQGGKCPICDKLLVEDSDYHGDRIAVDHDHSCCPGVKSCGKCVRGLLHIICNSLLGLAKDSPENLRRAARYLEEMEMSQR